MNTRRAAGFTLIELLIGVALSMIIMGVVTYGFSVTAKATTRGLGTNELHEFAASVHAIMRTDFDNRIVTQPLYLTYDDNAVNVIRHYLEFHVALPKPETVTFGGTTRTYTQGVVQYTVDVSYPDSSANDGFRRCGSYSLTRTFAYDDDGITYNAAQQKYTFSANTPVQTSKLVSYGNVTLTSDPGNRVGSKVYLPQLIGYPRTILPVVPSRNVPYSGIGLYRSNSHNSYAIETVRVRVSGDYYYYNDIVLRGRNAEGSDIWAFSPSTTAPIPPLEDVVADGGVARNTDAPAFLEVYIPFIKEMDGVPLTDENSINKRISLDVIDPDHPDQSSLFIWRFKL